MATQVNGQQKLLAPQYDTYEHWREYALTHGVNVDFKNGNQCWDICCFLWIQYNQWLYTGPNHSAYECYTYSRNRNAVLPFKLAGDPNLPAMERKKLIKKGDCVVFAPSGLNFTGHIAFADEDYNGTDKLKCLGQNQGKGSRSGVPSNIATLNLSRFLGGFRNINWEKPEPPPIVKQVSEHKFPWPVYARKFRNSR